MATKKNKQSAKSKKPVEIKKISIFSKIWQFIKDNPALAIIFVVFVAGIIYGSIYLFEKWQFASAEKKLDTVASALVAELGEPTSLDKYKTCSYQSTVFEDQRGLPSCGVSYKIVYSYNDFNEANSIRNMIDSTLKDSGYNLNGFEMAYYDDNPDTYEYPDNYTGDNVAFLNCSVNIENHNNKQVNVYLGCSNNSTLIKMYSEN